MLHLTIAFHGEGEVKHSFVALVNLESVRRFSHVMNGKTQVTWGAFPEEGLSGKLIGT